ncbi:hypothetical protein [Spirillospora sp. CA-294931]|uniref:hypothetical protein n=1 Tax=Spirillospora sp. CA-294931 TaxID=3240042 RepID=UPI003D916F68
MNEVSDPGSFRERSVPPSMERRVIVIEPGGRRPYDETEWLGALVVVESGQVDLETTDGGRQRFDTGAMLWLEGLPLSGLRAHGPGPAVLVAISRRPS